MNVPKDRSGMALGVPTEPNTAAGRPLEKVAVKTMMTLSQKAK